MSQPVLKSNYSRWLRNRGRKREAEFVEKAKVLAVQEYYRLKTLCLTA